LEAAAWLEISLNPLWHSYIYLVKVPDWRDVHYPERNPGLYPFTVFGYTGIKRAYKEENVYPWHSMSAFIFYYFRLMLQVFFPPI
jgi:hypothetical protein